MTTLQDLLIYKSIAGEGGGSQITVEPLNATENGIYNAGSGKAYNPVVVDVQPNLGTKKVTENATYRAVDDNLDGYSQVEVDVQIPAPMEPDFNKVTLWDYEGTLLYQYSLEEIQQLTELPTPPAHEGLTFLEWNWTLQQLKDENAPAIVGATYNTDDNHTRIYMNFNELPSELMPFGIKKITNGKVIIDWGDGSSVTEVAQAGWVYHTWELDTFPIEVCIDVYYDGTGDYILGDYASSSSAQTGIFNRNYYFTKRVTRAYLANNVVAAYYSNLFIDCYFLEEITVCNKNSVYNYMFMSPYRKLTFVCPQMTTNTYLERSKGYYLIIYPKNVTANQLGSNLYNGCSNLRCQYIPKTTTTLGTYVFASCIGLEEITIPSNVSSIGTSCFSNCTKLSSIKLPPLTSLGQTTFSNNPQMKFYDFTDWSLSDVQSCTFGSNIFQEITQGTKIIFATQAIADEAKQTTNLSTFASYITYVGAE